MVRKASFTRVIGGLFLEARRSLNNLSALYRVASWLPSALLFSDCAATQAWFETVGLTTAL